MPRISRSDHAGWVLVLDGEEVVVEGMRAVLVAMAFITVMGSLET